MRSNIAARSGLPSGKSSAALSSSVVLVLVVESAGDGGRPSTSMSWASCASRSGLLFGSLGPPAGCSGLPGEARMSGELGSGSHHGGTPYPSSASSGGRRGCPWGKRPASSSSEGSSWIGNP